jgi:hypothetical protein
MLSILTSRVLQPHVSLPNFLVDRSCFKRQIIVPFRFINRIEYEDFRQKREEMTLYTYIS